MFRSSAPVPAAEQNILPVHFVEFLGRRSLPRFVQPLLPSFIGLRLRAFFEDKAVHITREHFQLQHVDARSRQRGQSPVQPEDRLLHGEHGRHGVHPDKRDHDELHHVGFALLKERRNQPDKEEDRKQHGVEREELFVAEAVGVHVHAHAVGCREQEQERRDHEYHEDVLHGPGRPAVVNEKEQRVDAAQEEELPEAVFHQPFRFEELRRKRRHPQGGELREEEEDVETEHAPQDDAGNNAVHGLHLRRCERFLPCPADDAGEQEERKQDKNAEAHQCFHRNDFQQRFVDLPDQFGKARISVGEERDEDEAGHNSKNHHTDCDALVQVGPLVAGGQNAPDGQ